MRVCTESWKILENREWMDVFRWIPATVYRDQDSNHWPTPLLPYRKPDEPKEQCSFWASWLLSSHCDVWYPLLFSGILMPTYRYVGMGGVEGGIQRLLEADFLPTQTVRASISIPRSDRGLVFSKRRGEVRGKTSCIVKIVHRFFYVELDAAALKNRFHSPSKTYRSPLWLLVFTLHLICQPLPLFTEIFCPAVSTTHEIISCSVIARSHVQDLVRIEFLWALYCRVKQSPGDMGWACRDLIMDVAFPALCQHQLPFFPL